MKERRSVVSKIRKQKLTFYGQFMKQKDFELDSCSGIIYN